MTEELELPTLMSVVAAYPGEERNKTVVIEYQQKAGNRSYNGKRVQEKELGGVFSSTDSSGKYIERCFYDMVDGSPGVPFVIEDKVVLDLNNNIHFANYKMFLERLALYPESKEGIRIIDEINNNRANITSEEQMVMIKARIMGLKKDEKNLKIMYRRVVGATTGLTQEVIYGSLLEKANSNPSKIIEYFESVGGEDETFRMLLDVAKEKLIVIEKDKFLIIKATNVILGSNYENAVIRLRDDKEAFSDLQKIINDVDRVQQRPDLVKSKELSMDSALWDLEKTVKDVVMDSKSSDESFHMELASEQAMDDFIKNLVKNKVLSQGQNKKYNSELLPIQEVTKPSLVQLFKNNNGLIVQAKNYLR